MLNERFCASPGSSPHVHGGKRANAGRQSLDLTPQEKKQRAKDLESGRVKVSVTKDLKKRCMDMLKDDDPTVVVKDNAFAKLAAKLLERELQE